MLLVRRRVHLTRSTEVENRGGKVFIVRSKNEDAETIARIFLNVSRATREVERKR